jgi:hypothetical protein
LREELEGRKGRKEAEEDIFEDRVKKTKWLHFCVISISDDIDR